MNSRNLLRVLLFTAFILVLIACGSPGPPHDLDATTVTAIKTTQQATLPPTPAPTVAYTVVSTPVPTQIPPTSKTVVIREASIALARLRVKQDHSLHPEKIPAWDCTSEGNPEFSSEGLPIPSNETIVFPPY